MTKPKKKDSTLLGEEAWKLDEVKRVVECILKEQGEDPPENHDDTPIEQRQQRLSKHLEVV